MKSRPLFPWFAALALALAPFAAEAKVVTKTIAYEHDGKKLQGYLAYDDARSGARPGVLVVHEWWGLNDYTKSRARQLAELGYVAFAADMFGDGQVTRDPKQAQAWYDAATKTPGLLASRSKAGLDVLKKQSQVDPKRVGAIGFCFGGTTVLQLAYSGEEMKGGVVTFHGGLVVPDEATAAKIKTSIVVLNGAADQWIKAEDITNLGKALDKAKVDWYFVNYAGAVHAFSNPDADSFKIPNIGYNDKAARRSWDEMARFFHTQFAAK